MLLNLEKVLNLKNGVIVKDQQTKQSYIVNNGDLYYYIDPTFTKAGYIGCKCEINSELLNNNYKVFSFNKNILKNISESNEPTMKEMLENNEIPIEELIEENIIEEEIVEINEIPIEKLMEENIIEEEIVEANEIPIEELMEENIIEEEMVEVISEEPVKKSFIESVKDFSLKMERIAADIGTNYDGKYMGGLAEVKKQKDINFNISTKGIVFNIGLFNKVNIPIDSITNFRIMDQNEVHRDITLTRLFLFGLFAIGMKKKRIEQHYFIVIDYEDYGINNSIIIEMKNQKSAIKAHSNFIKVRRVALK